MIHNKKSPLLTLWLIFYFLSPSVSMCAEDVEDIENVPKKLQEKFQEKYQDTRSPLVKAMMALSMESFTDALTEMFDGFSGCCGQCE